MPRANGLPSAQHCWRGGSKRVPLHMLAVSSALSAVFCNLLQLRVAFYSSAPASGCHIRTHPRAQCGWQLPNGRQIDLQQPATCGLAKTQRAGAGASITKFAATKVEEEGPVRRRMHRVASTLLRLGALQIAAVIAALLHAPSVSAALHIANLEARATATFAGFVPALVTILLSEIGDKTFFVAMMLSLRRGRTWAFTSSIAALCSMTLISTGLGVAAKNFPAKLEGGQAYAQALTAACFAFFGVSSLLQARSAQKASKQDEQEAGETVEQTLGESQHDWREWWHCVVLVFLAEWADRSMLATIALAVVWNPVGVALGGMSGHVVATALAVFSGKALNKYINESTAKVVTGVMCLIFAVTSLVGVY